MKSLLLSAFALLMPFTALAKDAPVKTLNLDGDLYTKANMRYDAERKTGSYIQYLKLTLLPANSKVRVKDVTKKGFKMTVPGGDTIQVDYNKDWGLKPIDQILPDLFSEKETSAGIAKLKELDRKGVRSGRALVGMTKAGVIAALGLPAAHRTPSIDADTWVYWANRFVTFNVVFKNGKVEDIGSAGKD